MDNQRKGEGNTDKGITPRRVNRVYRQHKEIGEVPKPKKLENPKKNLEELETPYILEKASTWER